MTDKYLLEERGKNREKERDEYEWEKEVYSRRC